MHSNYFRVVLALRKNRAPSLSLFLFLWFSVCPKRNVIGYLVR